MRTLQQSFWRVCLPLQMADDNPGGDYAGARWSYHLARPPNDLAPDWPANNGDEPDVTAWLHDNVYDQPSLDPNATVARFVDAYRAEAQRLGVRADLTDWNALLNYVRLQLGTTSWAAIAGSAGSATPTGAGALSAPLLDVVAQQQDTAIASYKANPNNPLNAEGLPEESDATILSALHLTNSEAGALVSGGTLSVSPVPARDLADHINMTTPGSVTGSSPYGGLSSFFGIGPSGTLYDPQTGQPLSASAQPRGTGLSALLILGVVAAAAYFLWQSQGKG